MEELILDTRPLTLGDLTAARRGTVRLATSDAARATMRRGLESLQQILDSGRTVYGINTGFGKLASERISTEDLDQLQWNLVHSHAAGVGPPLSDSVVRLTLLLKIRSLAQGFSGIHPRTVDSLVALFNADALPVIPSRGSVGASGDLAPLAHLSMALLGEGQIRHQGQTRPAADVLADLGIEPLSLGPKEGLALLNGTQVSTALAIDALIRARQLFESAMIAGAMSVDAAMGSDTPFDPRIHELRPHPGQIRCAAIYRRLLEGSEIRQSHLDCSRVQDPYSLRCQPQVMGAVRDQIEHASKVLMIEANSVTDNPLLFPDENDVLSGGNFHAEPVALAADNMALAIAEIGALSERRIALLIDRNLSELPAFLVEHGGLNSGFMIPQVTAAALASENKSLAHPASVDSLPTSANQEDHVSMATFAARRLSDMIDNSSTIVAIELLAAAQGIDFRAPLGTSPFLRQVHAELRQQVSFYDCDRYFAPDIEAVQRLVISETEFLHALPIDAWDESTA